MKNIKKTLLFLIIICTSWLLSIKFFAAEVEEKFLFKMEIEENINLNGIEVSISKSEPIYVGSEISQFDNTFFEKYTLNSYGMIEFSRPSDFFLIEVNSYTLPNGYYVEEKSIFITNNINTYSIKLYNEELNSNLINNNIQNVNSQFSVQNEENNILSNKFVCGYLYSDVTSENGIMTLSDETFNWTNIPYNNSASVSNSRFEIIYDADTMSADKAQKVLTEIIKVENFFFLNNSLNSLSLPTSGNGKYKIYLAFADDIEEQFGSDVLGVALPNNTLSYMVLCYDLVAKINEFNKCTDNSFIATLAHEYVHSLCQAVDFIFNANNRWFTESLAEALSLYYVSENAINDSYIRDCFFCRIYNYFNTSNYSINDISIERREYDVMLFPFYIIQKYGYSVIKEIILNGKIYSDAYNNIDNILAKHNDTLDNFFNEFSIKNADIFSNYTLISTYYRQNFGEIDTNKCVVDNHKKSFNDSERISIPYYSETYIRLINNVCSYYDAYITINLSSTSNISITKVKKNDNDVTFINQNISSSSITIPQYNFGNSDCDELIYVISNYLKNNRTVTVNYSVSIIHQIPSISENNEVELSTNLNDLYTFKFVPTSDDLFEFTLENFSGNLPGYVVSIRDINDNAISKFDIDGFYNYANNSGGVNKFIAELEFGKTYYIEINYHNLTGLKLKISRINNLIELSEDGEYLSIDNDISKTDGFKKIVIPTNGYYNFSFTFNGIISTEFAYAIIKKSDDNLEYIETAIMTSSNKTNEKNNVFLEKDTIVYIGYIGYNQGDSYYELNINAN